MTQNENLLVIAMEECNELSFAISKALRFGMKNYYEEIGKIKDNNFEILNEYFQLKAVMEMLLSEGILEPISDTTAWAIQEDKEIKVKKSQVRSNELGLIDSLDESKTSKS